MLSFPLLAADSDKPLFAAVGPMLGIFIVGAILLADLLILLNVPKNKLV